MSVRQFFSFLRASVVCMCNVQLARVFHKFVVVPSQVQWLDPPRVHASPMVLTNCAFSLLQHPSLPANPLTTSRRHITRHIGRSNTHVMCRRPITKTNLCRLPQIGASHRPQITQKQPNTQGNQIVFFGNMRVNVSR